MTENIDIIKNRIRKLLALSKSDNENEAAIAMEKANALIEEYELDENALRFEQIKVKASKTSVPWKSVTANAVSNLYGCHWYIDQDNGVYTFTGEELDVFMATEMYSYLIGSIERCAKKAIRKNAKFKFRRDFKYGMASRLYDRIDEMGEACSWSPRRKIKIEEAKEYANQLVKLADCTPPKKPTKWNKAALRKGLLYGNDISLSRQAGFTPVQQIPNMARAISQRELF